MNFAEEKAIKNFFLDIDTLKQLDKWVNNFNIFDILKITNMEIRHSNIIAWLFDPNENHGLGDAFLKSFITKVVAKTDISEADAIDILVQNFYSYKVFREANNMDIVLCSQEEKTAIIIENKIWSGESPHQLKDYIKKSKTEYGYCNRIMYVFLTPDGHESSDPKNWLPFSYSEIIELLESVTNNVPLRDEAKLLINNYIVTVREKIMKEKDMELVRVCNEIFNKHKAALKLIFDNVKVDESLEAEIIRETLKELNDNGKIIYEENNKWCFFTKNMNNYLPDLKEPNSSWNTKYVYWYWFEKYGDTLAIHFELGGVGLTEELKKRETALIEASEKKGDINKYIYKRLFYKKVTLSQNNYEDSLKDGVKYLVKEALDNEERLLKKCRK